MITDLSAMPRPKISPGTADDIEAAFYDALLHGDVPRLMECWADEDDIVFEEAGARVFVSPMHLPYLAGSQVDWTRGDLREGFEVNNPNVKRTCGCGESFDV